MKGLKRIFVKVKAISIQNKENVSERVFRAFSVFSIMYIHVIQKTINLYYHLIINDIRKSAKLYSSLSKLYSRFTQKLLNLYCRFAKVQYIFWADCISDLQKCNTFFGCLSKPKKTLYSCWKKILHSILSIYLSIYNEVKYNTIQYKSKIGGGLHG